MCVFVCGVFCSVCDVFSVSGVWCSVCNMFVGCMCCVVYGVCCNV